MIRRSFIGLLLLFIASCQQEDKKVFLLFEESEGIGQYSPVMLNGVQIGKVLDVELTKDYNDRCTRSNTLLISTSSHF